MLWSRLSLDTNRNSRSSLNNNDMEPPIPRHQQELTQLLEQQYYGAPYPLTPQKLTPLLKQQSYGALYH